ncbi:MAG: MlaD family protein [Acidobacteriota bacterium]
MSQSFRIGLFLVATLAILACGVFLIGSKQSMFQSTYPVSAEFQNVAGLNSGAIVRVGGIPKGSIEDIRLPGQPGGKVVVLMNLDKSTKGVLRNDSVAAIKSEGLLGDKYIEISFGSAAAEQLKGGETLASQPPLDISDLLDKTNGILDTTQAALQNIQGATVNINEITAKINGGQGTMGALVNDKTIYKEAAASVTAFREDAEALKSNFLLRGFFNKRGYVDSTELKKHELPKLPVGTPVKRFSYDAKTIFDNPATAKMKNQKSLNEAGMYLQSAAFGTAVVSSAANMKGDSEKQEIATQAQAAALRTYLVQNFRLDDTRIKTMGLGKRADSGENGTIEILIYATTAAQAPAPAK